MTSPLKKPRRSITATRRAPSRTGVQRRTSIETEAAPEPLVLSDQDQALFQQGIILPHHKRHLILAHAEERKSRRMPHKWVYLMGVAASCLVVMAGWWFTVGSWIQGQLAYATHTGLQQEVAQGINDIRANNPIPVPSVASAQEILKPQTASATTSTVDNVSSR